MHYENTIFIVTSGVQISSPYHGTDHPADIDGVAGKSSAGSLRVHIKELQANVHDIVFKLEKQYMRNNTFGQVS
jgi:hypothetical protein